MPGCVSRKVFAAEDCDRVTILAFDCEETYCG
ncbi:MAG: hypothetical protein JWM91_5002 [Rhodospirillales bacterium]|nr:hypothetical protein [Rhodospirillales bacterium]